MAMKANLLQAKELAVFYMSVGLLPMLHGTYAVGKSSIVREIAEEFDLLLLDKRLSQEEPTDLKGYPKERNGRAYYAPPEDIPLEGDPLPLKYPAYKKGDIKHDGSIAVKDEDAVYYKGWLLFLDEINSADEDIQAAAYKITLDRKVGQDNVHPDCAMIAAGNLATDNAIVHEMSTALMTRMVHIEIENDLEVFMRWASKNKMDSRITSFLNWKPSYLHYVPEEQNDHTFATNRTWEFADRVFKNMDVKHPLFINALAGCITQGMAMELQTHIEVYATLPTYDDIVAKPEFLDIPEEPGTIWALIGFIGDKAQKKDIDQIMKLVTRLKKEEQVVLMLDMGRKHPDIMGAKVVMDWCKHNGSVVF